MKTKTTFYVEGTIDSLVFEVKSPDVKRFSLTPSPEFVITLPDGTKKILFLEKRGENTAGLVAPEKNGNGQEDIFFKVQCPCPCIMADILMRAKCNRSKIRVCVGSKNCEEDKAVLCPNIEDVDEIHFV